MSTAAESSAQVIVSNYQTEPAKSWTGTPLAGYHPSSLARFVPHHATRPWHSRRYPDARRERDSEYRPSETSHTPRSIPALPPTPLELRRQLMKEEASHKRPLDIPKPARRQPPIQDSPDPKRELVPERPRETQPRTRRDRLPPRHLGLQLRPEEVKLLSEVGRFRVITARDLIETVYHGQKGQLTHDLQFLRDNGLISTDFVNARRDGRLQKVERIEVVTHTRTGRSLVRHSGEVRPDQEVYAGLVKRREVEHDSQIYRAYLKEGDGIEQLGGKNPRVVLDFELKAGPTGDLSGAKSQSRTRPERHPPGGLRRNEAPDGRRSDSNPRRPHRI